MTKRMLIDANHPEETRVVVLQDRQLVDFDFESSTKRQLKGNVYLAKVTRVEPSLQAAFIEYGGNRHGFLAFSEIHPDYFQIPQADRELLAKLERESAEADSGNGNGDGAAKPARRRRRGAAAANGADNGAGDEGDAGAGGEDGEDEQDQPIEVRQDAEEETADVMSEQARRRAKLLRSYKIQEVIKRRQIMLVQVVKEERGTKGAALTTYLSLAGRYCVLMPNTARGGGISRKINSGEDRAKLKSIVAELDVPQGMGLIVRTAGQQRSRTEIKRDYDYLMRQWSDIRDTTLKSVAPALIYAEGDLIKRAMRDLYSRDIDEVLVEGEAAHRSAKRLMTMMMPSRARHVKLYKEELPLFFKYKVEDQLDAMHSPTVQLPSGGSIVMHATEALIAIDVNSGKSTRERHIDETAVKTNLEAADEIARQLRLRDLAGLVVIDFIDMAENRHQRSVERRLRDALKIDRARIQLGKISMFGLMELSRQRLRPSLQELSSQVCPTCQGLGSVRSTESCALQALRLAEEAGIRGEAKVLRLLLPAEVALYVLNQKRDGLVRLEQRYFMRIEVMVDGDSTPGHVKAEVIERRDPSEVVPSPAPTDAAEPVDAVADEEVEDEAEDEVEAEEERPARRPVAEGAAGEDEEGARKRRRRRRRRRRGDEAPAAEAAGAEAGATETADEVSAAPAATAAGYAEVETGAAEVAAGIGVDTATAPLAVPEAGERDVAGEAGLAAAAAEPPVADEEEAAAEVKKPKRRRRTRKAVAADADEAPALAENGAVDAAPPSGAVDAAVPEVTALDAGEAAGAVPAAADAAADTVAGEVPALAEPVPTALSAEPPAAAEAVEPEPAAVEPAPSEQQPEPATAEGGPAVADEPSEAADREQPAERPREMALADAGDEEQPARQGWWSRWVR
jgi:ribonuclease E